MRRSLGGPNRERLSLGERMAEKPEQIGLLLVHGVGEQQEWEHLRLTANEIASYVGSSPGLIRLNVDDQCASQGQITIDATFMPAGSRAQRRVQLHCREVWWANLGMHGGLVKQVAFWFWGLGQWAAEVRDKGRRLSNTSQLMDSPAFQGDPPQGPPGARHRWLARSLLFAAGVLALLTLVTWSLLKKVVAFLAPRIPDASLIFLFLGDVKVYQQPGGPGRGTPEDPDMPTRTTIRRRMVSAMVDMAAAGHDRWYVLAHSLGSVVAFNGLQETELALPNYLTQAKWQSLPPGLKTTKPYKPRGAKPSTKNMMPRRPPWLADHDGLSRSKLFERFSGLITYGCPLDKFAALWPRIVFINKQAGVFRKDCEWLNIYDPTDPVSAALDAFSGKPGTMPPANQGCRASKAFLLSHIRYFSPRRRREQPIAGAIIDALLRGESLATAAGRTANTPLRNRRRHILAIIQVMALFPLLALAAAGLIIAGTTLLLGADAACRTSALSLRCAGELGVTGAMVFGAAILAVLVAGLLRILLFDRWYKGK